MLHARPVSRLIARTVAYAATLALLGWVSTAVSAHAESTQAQVPSASTPSVQVANLLVPKRTRLVIHFERTAIC